MTLYTDGNGKQLTHTVQGTTFTNNTAANKGGALAIVINEHHADQKVVVKDSTFTGNKSTEGNGGAVLTEDDLSIEGTTFTNNSAEKGFGGALYAAKLGDDTATELALSITKSTFEGNKAKDGGAVYVGSGVAANATLVTYKGNTATGNGGAVVVDGGVYAQVGGSFVGNKAVTSEKDPVVKTANGGAVFVKTDVTGDDLVLDSVLVSGNSASNGGAVYVEGGADVKFIDTTFTDNTATGWGGAVRLNNGDATFKITKGDIVYSGNKAGTDEKDAVNTKYLGNAGDFMYMNGNSTVAFDIAKDASLTIEDSIASYNGDTITKTGAGKLTVKDVAAFAGNLAVHAGAMEIAGDFATYEIAAQAAANALTGDSTANGAAPATTTTVTVATGAKLAMGDVTVNRAVNFTVVDSGSLTMKSLSLTTKDYADLYADPKGTGADGKAEKLSTKVVTTKGASTIVGKVAVEGAVTAGNDTTLTVNGDLTAGSVNTAAVVKDGDTVKKVAGQVVVNLGNKVIVNGTAESLNAGTITLNGALDILGGTFTNTGAIAGGTISTPAGALNIAGTLDNQSTVIAKDITIAKGGVLNTGVNIEGKDSYIVFDTLNLEEKGVFNMTKANSTLGTGKEAVDAVTFNLGTVNLNGGTIQLAGKTYTGAVKVDDASVVNVNGGFYTVSDLTITKTAKVNVGENGTLSVTGKVENVANSLTNAGKLTVTASGIDLKLKDGAVESVTGSKFNKISNTGTVVVTGLDGQSVKIANVANVKAAVVDTATSTGFVDLGKVTVDFGSGTATETGYDSTKNTLTNATAGALAGMSLDQFKNTTVTGVDASTGVAGGNFGALQSADANGVKVAGNTILNNDGLVAHDKDGNAVKSTINASQTLTTTGANAQIGEVTGAGTLEIGAGKLTSAVSSAATATTTTYYGIDVANLNVAEGAALESKGTVTIQTAGNIAGSATIGTLGFGATTTLGITGNAVVDTLAGGTATINVGNPNATGSMTVVKQTGGTVIVDPAFSTGLPAATYAVSALTGGRVVAAENSYVAVGADIAAAKSAFAKTGYTLAASGANTVRAVAYVAGNKDANGDFVAIGGDVMAEGQTGAALGTGTAANAMMIVDVATVDTSANQTAVFANAFTNNGILYLANAVNGDSFTLTSGALTQSGQILVDGGRMIGATADTLAGVVTVAIGNHNTLAGNYEDLDTFETTYAAFANGAVNGSSSSQRFAKWLFEDQAINGLSDDDVEEVGNAVAYIGATAGLANVTMDAVSEFNDSVAARTSILAQRGEGVNVWVDVNGGKFEGKKVVDGEVGYSSDLYGAVLGADVTVACGATVGAALTVGTADTDSKGDSVKTSVDTDFVGIGFYANKPIGEVANVAFDLGYIQASNELSVKEYGIGKTDADTDAVTFGVRGELLAKVGAIDVVPHVGLRWTRLSFDQFEAGYVTDIDSMNVFQMPVGVTFKGDVEVEGWNIAPAFDLTFTPTWGDKDMEQKVWVAGSSVKDTLEGTRVLDNNVVNATLGVAAQNGAWTFGLDYKLGVGSDDRMNNSFNARVNYAF